MLSTTGRRITTTSPFICSSFVCSSQRCFGGMSMEAMKNQKQKKEEERLQQIEKEKEERDLVRNETLNLFKRMMKAGVKWESGQRSEGGKGGMAWNKRVREMWGVEGEMGGVVSDAREEGFALCQEIRQAFQENKEIEDLEEIKIMIQKGEQRLGLLEHYGTPFEKVSAIPHSYSAQDLNNGVNFQTNTLATGLGQS